MGHHLKTRINLEAIGPVDVSTIDLSQNSLFRTSCSETCLFWKGASEVVETYATWEEAVERHQYWCEPANAAQAIANYRSYIAT